MMISLENPNDAGFNSGIQLPHRWDSLEISPFCSPAWHRLKLWCFTFPNYRSSAAASMLSSFHVVISVAVTVVTVAVELTEVSCEAELSSSRSLLQSKVDLVPPKAMVFYNLFAENMFQVPRIAKIARGQLAHVDPKHYDLSINSIGAITDVSQLALDPFLAQRTRFVHYKEGQETLTLHDVWSYCRRHDVLPSQAGHSMA